MNRIDKNNYEAYLLDYHEGNLNAEEKQDVLSFLKDYPEFYDEFQDFENVILPVPDITYPDKSELFKAEVSIPEADDWEFKCIAFMEGDLSEKELHDFNSELHSDPEKSKILELYLATRSVPDENILFGEKAGLKKKVVLIPRWIYGAVSAAAILILSWIVFSPFSGENNSQQMADETSREHIFMDKLAHPGKYEKIASSSLGPGSLKKHTSIFSGTDTDTEFILPIDDSFIARDEHVMAAISTSIITRVVSETHYIPSAHSSFAYRYIPGAEEEEYQTLVAFAGDYIRKQLLGQDPELVKKSKFSFWELADAGLEKASDVFGTGADIEREYSNDGQLMAVSFESALVGFNTPVKRRTAIQVD